jgi:hypothetical protein
MRPLPLPSDLFEAHDRRSFEAINIKQVTTSLYRKNEVVQNWTACQPRSVDISARTNEHLDHASSNLFTCSLSAVLYFDFR